MKVATVFVVLSVLVLLLPPVIAAPWTWEKYTGVTQWRVDVTEDETACGGTSTTESYAVPIQHNEQTVDVGNWGHGKTRGAFTDNTLSIPSRTVPDGAGKSTLSGFDMVFTLDCAGFTGKYRWDYADAAMRCSGTTTLRGTRADGKGCPAEEQTEEQRNKEIADIRAVADMEIKERRYADILAENPKDFWANWDMAELKKKQGKYQEFFDHFNRAVSNEKIFPDTREQLRKEELKRLHLSTFPTRETSPILRIEEDQVNAWPGGSIFDLNIPKEAAVEESWSTKLWALLAPDTGSVAEEIAYR